MRSDTLRGSVSSKKDGGTVVPCERLYPLRSNFSAFFRWAVLEEIRSGDHPMQRKNHMKEIKIIALEEYFRGAAIEEAIGKLIPPGQEEQM